MSRRVAPLDKAPLLGYHVMASRAAVAVPWYLAGGVSAANCVAAYQPIGAASYAASKVNLANPGTYDATDNSPVCSWSASDGWYNGCVLVNMPTVSQTSTWIARYSVSNLGAYRIIYYLANFTIQLHSTFGQFRNGSVFYPEDTFPTNTDDSVGFRGIDAMHGSDVIGSLTPGSTVTNSGSTQIGDVNGYTKLLAFAYYDTVITAEQYAAISAAMAALDGGAKSQSLEGMLSFEAEEEKLWWQAATFDAQEALHDEPQPELSWWGKAKKYINDKLYQLWQAIEDYFDYHEEI